MKLKNVLSCFESFDLFGFIKYKNQVKIFKIVQNTTRQWAHKSHSFIVKNTRAHSNKGLHVKDISLDFIQIGRGIHLQFLFLFHSLLFTVFYSQSLVILVIPFRFSLKQKCHCLFSRLRKGELCEKIKSKSETKIKREFMCKVAQFFANQIINRNVCHLFCNGQFKLLTVRTANTNIRKSCKLMRKNHNTFLSLSLLLLLQHSKNVSSMNISNPAVECHLQN